MISKIKEWAQQKLYELALGCVCRYSINHRDLEKWLCDNPDSLDALVTASFHGRKLEFKWIPAPERGRSVQLEDNISKNNALFAAFQKESLHSISGGKTILEEISYMDETK